MPSTPPQTYDQAVIPQLVTTMKALLDHHAGLRVLLSATIRNEQTFEAFLNACSGSLPLCSASVAGSPVARDNGGCGVADLCGVGRNRLCFERVDFPPVPEDEQDGPFYPTSTPLQIWCLTRPERP